MLTTNKSHCLSIGKFRRRVNSPPGKPGGPFIIAGSFASLRMTTKELKMTEKEEDDNKKSPAMTIKKSLGMTR